MQIHFSKYQGTGNDFIILDNRDGSYNNILEAQIKKICDRHFGVGADGLMLLENDSNYDFRMKYYNADGKESTMCGNGGRCMVAYANYLGIIHNNTRFTAIDGLHEANYETLDFIELKMHDVMQIAVMDNSFILDTGSPHFVRFEQNVKHLDVRAAGSKIRYNSEFAKDGINVNFMEVLADKTLFVATYERGVEDETLSCGTGVVASALVQVRENIGGNYVRVSTKGGTLLVKCVNQNKQHFTDIWLCGPAKFIYNGSIEL
jgi:diaminopimelate epimerase